MKNLLSILAIIYVAFTFTSCTNPGVDAGEEMVIIQKPWIFGSGGVKDDPVTSGRKVLAMSTDYVKYNVKPVKHEEKFDDVITLDNNPVDFAAYIQTQIQAKQSPKLHKLFGEKWYENNVEDQFRAKIRGYCSKYPMFTLSTDRNIVDSLELIILSEMQAYVKSLDMPVNINQVIIGKVTPPTEVLDETTKTAAATQSIKTQNARELAESAREKADIAKAKADMAYMNAFNGMTVNQYLTLRSLEIEKEKIDMVKGKKNVTINMVQGGGAQPVIPLK